MKINRQTRFFFNSIILLLLLLFFLHFRASTLALFLLFFFLYNFHALKEKNIAKIRDATRGYKMGNGFKRCEISINKS